MVTEFISVLAGFGELAAEVGQSTVVDGFQDDVLRYKAGVQGSGKTPYSLVNLAYRKITSN